jgi:hypothetical protein
VIAGDGGWDGLERRLRERLEALGPAPRAELLRVLMLPDFERAERIGEFCGHPESRSFAELLIDCELDRERQYFVSHDFEIVGHAKFAILEIRLERTQRGA